MQRSRPMGFVIFIVAATLLSGCSDSAPIASSSARGALPSTPPSGSHCGESDPPTAADHELLVYFMCGLAPAAPRAVLRTAPVDRDLQERVEFAIGQVLSGPSGEESAQGYDAAFPRGAEQLLAGVEVTDDGLAIVDFHAELQRVGNLSASAARFAVFGTLGDTIFQFPQIDAIEYRIDGSCELWSAHFETVPCEPMRRGG